MRKIDKVFWIVFLGVCSGFSNQLVAQDVISGGVEMLRKDGKFYVVVASILIIFAGLVVYLFALDKKITKLEKSKNQKEI